MGYTSSNIVSIHYSSFGTILSGGLFNLFFVLHNFRGENWCGYVLFLQVQKSTSVHNLMVCMCVCVCWYRLCIESQWAWRVCLCVHFQRTWEGKHYNSFKDQYNFAAKTWQDYLTHTHTHTRLTVIKAQSIPEHTHTNTHARLTVTQCTDRKSVV